MDYIIKREGNTEHYFYRQGEGVKLADEANLFIPESVFKEAKEPFCVFKKDEILHIICINKENMLIYIPKKGSDCKLYTLCELKEGFNIKNIKIASSGEMLSLLYSAEYDGELLLVHCILGNHAQPAVIDKMSEDYFFIYNERVYYTNKSGVLGFQELNDGKPDRFIIVAENAAEPYLYSDGGNEYIVYKREESLYVNHIPKVVDREAKNPILVKRNGRTILMWQSGAVIKYIDLNNENEAPKRLISSGQQILYSVQEGGHIYYDYASKSNSKPYFADIGTEREVSTTNHGNNLNDITDAISQLKKQIEDIEEKIKKMT